MANSKLDILLNQLNASPTAKNDQPLWQVIKELIRRIKLLENAAGSSSSSVVENITQITQQIVFGEGGGDGEIGPPGVRGLDGAMGIQGPTGPPFPSFIYVDADEPESVLPIPGPQGPQGVIGLTGAAGLQAIGFVLYDEPEDVMPIPGPAGSGGSGGSGALTLLGQFTAAVSATLDFTSLLTATYDDYLIELLNVLPATSGAMLRMKVSFDNGATWQAGANYRSSVFLVNSNAFTTLAASNNGTSSFYVGGTLQNGATGTGVCGTIHLHNPLNAAQNKVWQGSTIFRADDTNNYVSTTGLSYLANNAINAIQFLMDSGNITSGTIRLYGYQK